MALNVCPCILNILFSVQGEASKGHERMFLKLKLKRLQHLPNAGED